MLDNPNGIDDIPLFKIPAYAPVISSKVLSAVPSAIDGTNGILDLMPKSFAIAFTRDFPISSLIFIATVFVELAKAFVRLTSPSNLRL